MSITINNHEYTKEEVFEALKKKGYTLLHFHVEKPEHGFMGGIDYYEEKTTCAVKGADLPALKNTWQNVALKEFDKKIVKPPLI